MAEKKTTTTSAANLFGQPLGAELNFDQFSSGPRLFTPIPPSQNTAQKNVIGSSGIGNVTIN